MPSGADRGLFDTTLMLPRGSLRRCHIRSHSHLASLTSRPDTPRVGDSLKWGGSPKVKAEAATKAVVNGVGAPLRCVCFLKALHESFRKRPRRPRQSRRGHWSSYITALRYRPGPCLDPPCKRDPLISAESRDRVGHLFRE